MKILKLALTELVLIVVRDGGALVPSAVDFLVAGGFLPVQGLMEEKAAGSAGGTCCATKKVPELRRTYLFFSLFLSLSVRCSVDVIFIRKKKNLRPHCHPIPSASANPRRWSSPPPPPPSGARKGRSLERLEVSAYRRRQ